MRNGIRRSSDGLFLPVRLPSPEARDTLTAAKRSELVASGEFIHAHPSDPIHYDSGKVSVYQDLVFLEQDFEVGPGPAFHVYLVPKTTNRSSADVEGTMFVDLGQLRAFKGS
ncbi:MAG: DM13 domain-containing protein [Rhizobiales bacterium]|nr:DM13 domain-containing protein [Hyphomicrobiales bacterium]